jgi:hypothetical protein
MDITAIDLKLILKIGSGIFWLLVYVIIIVKGFKDKTYGMPMPALCANISWEAIFSFIYPHDGAQLIINILWFLFDLLILYQLLKYGKKANNNHPFYLFIVIGVLILSFFAVYSTIIEFHDFDGKYSAFPQNLMMSILFIFMLIKRNNLSGQSIYIAIFKMLGTLFPSLLFVIYYPSILIIYLSITIFIFDWIYIVILYKKYKLF